MSVVEVEALGMKIEEVVAGEVAVVAGEIALG